MSSKAILTTLYTGFNYGSSLQALAGKTVIENVGLECELVKLKSLVKGRDIRLGKLFTIVYRALVLGNANSLKAYGASYQKKYVEGTEELFFSFTNCYLQPKEVSWRTVKRMANEAVACFSGSDQIWNSASLYVDPLYYLRFAPAYKRVALSPSFGRDFVADYNVKKMGKWIGEYAHLSVREDSGVKMIKDLTGRTALHLLDPTLMLKSEQWKQILGIASQKGNYILAYFLDKPADFAIQQIKALKTKLGCEVIALPFIFDDMGYSDRVLAAGPKEFVELIANARLVCTDSFHGMVFSLNMHTPF
ncbi:Polysaccharide pyruvyl transferase, partial [gut metagenome]